MEASRPRLVLRALIVAGMLTGPAVARAQDAGDASLAGGSNDAVANMKGALLSDEQSRQQVLSLQDDPQVKAILDDPATMRAVQSGDLNALMNDPKLRALLDNPTVRSLVDQQSR
jgi:hypothetical protein